MLCHSFSVFSLFALDWAFVGLGAPLTGRVRATVDADGDAIVAFALHPNDREVVVACKSGLVKHWRLGAAAHDGACYADADAGEWLDANEHDDDFAESVAADAAAAAAAESDDQAAPNKQHTLVRSFKGHEMDVTEIAFDLSATLIATASLDRTIRVRSCDRDLLLSGSFAFVSSLIVMASDLFFTNLRCYLIIW